MHSLLFTFNHLKCRLALIVPCLFLPHIVGVLNPLLELVLFFLSPQRMVPLKAAEHCEALSYDGEKNSTSFSQTAAQTTSQEIEKRFFSRFVSWISSSGIEINGYVTGESTTSLSINHDPFLYIELLQFLPKRGLTLDYTNYFLFGLQPVPTF